MRRLFHPILALDRFFQLSAIVLPLCLATTITRGDIFEPGSGLPDLELQNGAGGGPFNLQSLKGKKTVLFIFASW